MSPFNDPAFTFICGWAACVLFIAAWEWLGAVIEQSRPHSVSERDGNPCPWPIDDEAERDGLISEFHPFHGRGNDR